MQAKTCSGRAERHDTRPCEVPLCARTAPRLLQAMGRSRQRAEAVWPAFTARLAAYAARRQDPALALAKGSPSTGSVVSVGEPAERSNQLCTFVSLPGATSARAAHDVARSAT